MRINICLVHSFFKKICTLIVNRRNFLCFLLLFGFLSTIETVQARRAVQKIQIKGELRNELNALLKATVDLQQSSYKRKEKGVISSMRQLQMRLKSVAKKVYLAKQQSTHLIKIINSAQLNLGKAQKARDSRRHTFLQHVFSQLVIVAQLYQLDTYKIFFCPKDKSVWLQKGSQPQNPVNPETFGNCGKLVP